MRPMILATLLTVACGPVAEPVVNPETCMSDADCIEAESNTCSGDNSRWANSANPAPTTVPHEGVCHPACDSEISHRCVLPACPTGEPIMDAALRGRDYGSQGVFEARNYVWLDGVAYLDCPSFLAGRRVSIFYQCGFRRGVIELDGHASPVTDNAWTDDGPGVEPFIRAWNTNDAPTCLDVYHLATGPDPWPYSFQAE